MELQERLKRQVNIALWELILFITYIVGIIVMATSLANADNGYGYDNSSNMPVAALFGIFLLAASAIATFIIWVIGIINAVAINKITQDSTILIVFSVITLIFGHLIVAVGQKNKYEGVTIHEPMFNQHITNTFDPLKSEKTKLKQAFMDGIITSEEYERKIKELEEKNNK